MPVGQLNKVIRHLRGVLDRQNTAEIRDGDLLRRYVQERDEAAFAALVRRHGPMVLGVCRRVLHNLHDAEDAFQASFLVLVSKASTLRTPGRIGNWLYGVAYRTALHARSAAAQRRAREAAVIAPTEAPEDPWADLRLALDQELERLPEKYRTVVILCDLEGKTRAEAAGHLGWAEGTVASRLARGRALLARRLTRHGLALTGAALAAALSPQATAAGVPPALAASTIKVASLFAAGEAAVTGAISAKAAVLAKGVLTTMFLTKLKMTTAALVVMVVLGGGVAGLTYRIQAAEPARGIQTDQIRTSDLPPGTQFRPDNRAKPPQPRDPEALSAEAALKKASVGGKYSVLLKKIEVKADRDTHQDFHDYGAWQGTSWAGYENLPVGYWVYVYPNWYIWGMKDAAPQEDDRKAAVGGKYSVLLRKIEVKADRATYQDFNDYGPWQGTSWAGYENLPDGYWVYVYPNWYIWGVKQAPEAEDLKKPSVTGKYSRLLKKIEARDDRAVYTDYSDYGPCNMPSYAGQVNLPAGYWVYVYPYWYIWGDTTKDQ